MVMSTDTDVQEYFPDLYDYGIQDFSAEHAKTQGDIERRLRIDWWPRKRIVGEMDASLITQTQFTRAAVFHTLSHYILPKLTKFAVDGDRFENMMEYFTKRFTEEFNMILQDGVEYDANDDDSISNSEKVPNATMRLVR